MFNKSNFILFHRNLKLSKFLFDNVVEHEKIKFDDTVKHEVAHALAGAGNGHNHIWKRVRCNHRW
jgi:hypothetical protein